MHSAPHNWFVKYVLRFPQICSALRRSTVAGNWCFLQNWKIRENTEVEVVADALITSNQFQS